MANTHQSFENVKSTVNSLEVSPSKSSKSANIPKSNKTPSGNAAGGKGFGGK